MSETNPFPLESSNIDIVVSCYSKKGFKFQCTSENEHLLNLIKRRKYVDLQQVKNLLRKKKQCLGGSVHHFLIEHVPLKSEGALTCVLKNPRGKTNTTRR